jgi:protein-tyrosine-phosphatase
MVDELALGDRTVAELADSSGMRGNLLAHHLDVLESAGLIERRVSEGDRRRRYVSLRWDRLPIAVHPAPPNVHSVAFVCTHNSARSQFAAALWEQTTGMTAGSAGTAPAARVHPLAVEVASEFGLDISGAVPRGYDELPPSPDLVISVCDRALEGGVPPGRTRLHWSVPDPVRRGSLEAFRSAFSEIAERVGHLTGSATDEHQISD